MKAGDRFLHDCGSGCYGSYRLVETCGFWYLIDEKYGSLWCSPQKNYTPISAFGGEKWHDSFRKIPDVSFETKGDTLYAHHSNGTIVNVTVDYDGATEMEYLINSKYDLDWDTLEEI